MTLRAALIRAGLLSARYALLERRKERTRDLLERELPNARRLYQQMRRSLGMAAQKETQAAADDDLPRPLAWLMRELKRRLGDLFDDLTGERITPIEWRNAVKRVLSEFHLTAMMAGLNTEAIPGKAWNGLVEQINVQLEFLNQFRVEVQDDATFKPGWDARARSYAESIKVPYWRGRTKILPLPAMPGEGSQCLQGCNCKWDVKMIDAANGDYDAYWRLEKGSKHCQTCLERAAQWSPLRIREGVLQ